MEFGEAELLAVAAVGAATTTYIYQETGPLVAAASALSLAVRSRGASWMLRIVSGRLRIFG